MRFFRSFSLVVCVVLCLAPTIWREGILMGQSDNGPLRTIVFLGDSLSAGYGLLPSQAFPALIQQKVDKLGWNYKVTNAGVSGDTSAGGLRRIDWLLEQKIDVLVLELGANDGLRGISLDLTERNLQAILDKVKRKNSAVRIVVAGMRVPPNLGQKYTKRFHSMFSNLARNNAAVLIPFLLEQVAGEAHLNLPDGIHPTAEGHKVVAETVWEILEPLLR